MLGRNEMPSATTSGNRLSVRVRGEGTQPSADVYIPQDHENAKMNAKMFLGNSLLISTEYQLHVFWREKRWHGYGLSKKPKEPIRLFLISL
jgi:hypothetical protein